MIEENSKIKILSEHIIDQIKAGEVIERPSSLLKELIENSIDANADEIHIHLVDNGLTLIQIEDNGNGMNFIDLPLAFSRHATSKIHQFDDLYRLHSYGFRGEALASAASISKITCTSFEKNLEGGKIILEGGKTISHLHEKSHGQGTTIYIKDLFYNTPARLKFVKSKSSEKASIKRIIDAYVLAYPHITFSLKFDAEEKKVFLKSTEGIIGRIKNLIGKKQSEGIVHLKKSYHSHEIELFLIPSAEKKLQLIFANLRPITDKQIHAIINEQIGPNLKMDYCLFIRTNPEDIDVNVHPNKTVVKFYEQAELLSLIAATSKALKNNLHHFGFTLTSNLPHYSNENVSPKDYIFENKSNVLQTSFEVAHFYFDDGIHFISKNKDAFIFDENKYLQTMLIEDLVKSQESVPQLIGVPLTYICNSNLLLNFLQKYNIEIERLNEKMVIIRSLPQGIDEQMLTTLIQKLLNLEFTQKNLSLNYLFKIFLEKNTQQILPMEFVFNLTFSNDQQKLVDQRIIKKITSLEMKRIYE